MMEKILEQLLVMTPILIPLIGLVHSWVTG